MKGERELLALDAPPRVTDPVVNGAGGGSILPYIPADLIAPDFLNIYRDIRDRRHMEYVLYGGRGSTKSSFVSIAFIYLLINNDKIHGLAVRQVKETLRDSVFGQLKWAIN